MKIKSVLNAGLECSQKASSELVKAAEGILLPYLMLAFRAYR